MATPFNSLSFVGSRIKSANMKHLVYLFAGATLFFTACNSEEESTTEEQAVMTQTGISLSDVEGSPDFDGASLSVGSITTEADGDKVNVKFNFDVLDYELMNQTDDADSKMCANSGKGQHIHFILDNQPYAALYEPTHTVSLEKNSEHYLLAFLSRSYHESVKSEGASLVYHFKVDENGNVVKMDDPTEPMLFYSRPKGDYVGKADIDNLLFDFFPWNTEIGNDGNHVLAHIKGDGVDTTMVIKDWKAYFLHNMPTGSPSITLTLVDKDGNKIEGPMTEVTRDFTLSLDEPIAH